MDSHNKNAPIAVEPEADAVIDDAILHQFVGYHMRRAANLLQADMARTLKEIDLRMITMSVLVVVVDNPGLRQSQLADALAIERPNLVSILDELESRNLVLRTRVPTDRRAYALTPTAAGRTLAQRALALTTEHEDRVLAGITPEERSTLVSLMQRIGSASGDA
ncbi:Multidrug resistance operon repressor [Roseivivax jejudonensis]|uniref:Multidrug resistance operon repressor n=1 Tax=Roseivivax jejudonensis TaxID=1529041 RepID=A0A1X6YHY2_9RHOB|nr:MarR family transcriptional regulator [Roseivivax jejudonensis]SLN21874.1 Multidrug resistance operon repressor [Roseivivax jejudonensis]